METAARRATASPIWMSAVLSMPPVYRRGRIGPPMLPDGWGPCDGWAGSLPWITGSPAGGGAVPGGSCRFRGLAQELYAEGAFLGRGPVRTAVTAVSVAIVVPRRGAHR